MDGLRRLCRAVVKILVVSPLLPYEGVPHAGGHFLLRHLERLLTVHEVRLYVPGAPSVLEVLDRVPAWLPLTITPFDGDRRTGMRDVWYWIRRRCRFRALQVPAARGFREIGFPRLAMDADILELEWIDAAVLVRSLRAAGVDVPIVVVLHDITAHARPALRRLTASRWTEVRHALLDRIRVHFEVADLNLVDLVLVFKEEDRSVLEAMGVHTPSYVIEPSLELPRAPIPPRTRQTVLFTGAMWRRENQHGVEWFLREVWPTVVCLAPESNFVVVGDSPPEWLVALGDSSPRTVVTGTVDDLSPYYESASAFVAPLFVPGGLKFKVPQAMVFDLPVVATPVAVEGLRAPSDALWAVTEDASEMARAIVGLLQQPETAAETGRIGGGWVRQNYSFAASTPPLLERYQQLVEGRDARRRPR